MLYFIEARYLSNESPRSKLRGIEGEIII